MMFESEAIQDIISYKWKKYAWKIHYIGALAHTIFIITFSFYINTTYNTGKFGEIDELQYPILMCVSISYPFLYETI